MKKLWSILIMCGAVATTSAGCTLPSYTHGRASLTASATPSAMAECYHQRRLELSESTARWKHSTGSLQVGYITTTTFHNRATGVSFRQGGKRLSLKTGLSMLQDPELESSYWAIVDATESDHRWYRIYRNASYVLGAGGVGVGVGMLGLVLAGEESNEFVTLGLVGTVTLAVASLIPHILASTRYKGAIKHDVYKNIFAEASYAARLDEDTARYNAQIQRACAEQIK